MKILLNNCTLANQKKVNILIEDNIFTQISTDYIRVETDLTFDLSNKLIFPGIINLNQDLFKNLDNNEKIISESKAFAKGGITSLINLEKNKSTHKKYDIESLSRQSLFNIGETSVINFFDDFNVGNDYIFNTLYIGEVDNQNDDEEYWKWFQSRIRDIQNQSKILFVSMKDPGLSSFLKYVPKNKYKICFYDFNKASEIYRILNFKQEGFNFYISFDVNSFFLCKEMIKNNLDSKRLSFESGYSQYSDIQFFVDALKRGWIDIVYSNHSPNMIWEKYELNKLGVPSAETLLPLMLELATYANVGIHAIWKVLCENPCNILNIEKRGKIEVGYYADLIVIDLERFWYITNSDIISQAKWTPYDGKRVWGVPIITFLNGKIIYDTYDSETNFLEEENVSEFLYSR